MKIRNFRFKYFSLTDNNCGMKICSDSVIFGAWIGTSKSLKVLDIGTGSGLLSLMIAQRCEAHITAIEICNQASHTAELNFAQSPWHERLKVVNCSFMQFLSLQSCKYDTIVCNPPWFNSVKPQDAQRQKARHSESLSKELLLHGISELLSDRGTFNVILPYPEKSVFCDTALINGLYLKKETIIIPKKGKPSKRALLSFSKERSIPVKTILCIYDENGSYSEEYKSLTKDYYLSF